jgi:hypothetical protein
MSNVYKGCCQNNALCMYLHDKIALPVPAALMDHFEMLKVLALLHFCCICGTSSSKLHDNYVQSIRHMCENLCALPGNKKHSAPLMNYACRTGNNSLLVFCLKMQASVLQVKQTPKQ